ncbi:MAG: methylated-DNA--[protein]-cysteine S-methyltransferase [Methylophagaceae bacterium]
MNSHYEKVEQAIYFINENIASQPSLDEIAASVYLSPFHFQRLFREWAGITPKRFLQYLTVSHAKQLLEQSSVLDVSIEMGLSSQSRLYEHFITLEGVSPGEFKSNGHCMVIEYGMSYSPFGLIFIAATERGICQLSFIDKQQYQDSIESLQSAWPNATILNNPLYIDKLSQKIFTTTAESKEKFHLLVKGSNFQIKVWESLLKIPSGMAFSYQQISHSISKPTANRAVATAISKNPIAYLIPCHRVIRKTGIISGYRWGCERKQAIIAWEAAHSLNTTPSISNNQPS